MNILKLQRLLGNLEGVSALLLFFIAMPLKYIWGDPSWVKLIGTIHGVLFIIYIVYSLFAKVKLNWSLSLLVMVGIGSIVPFGTFYVDYKYLKGMEEELTN